MNHVSDYTQSAKKIITDLILFDNPGLNLTVDQVDYLNPRPVQAGVRNTILTVIPRSNSEYTGQVNVRYRRLDIQDFSDVFFPMGLEIQEVEGATAMSEIVPAINLALGIQLASGDYIESSLPVLADGLYVRERAILRISEFSLVYIGELEFIYRSPDISLLDEVAVRYLTGLNYPEAPPTVIEQLEDILSSEPMDGLNYPVQSAPVQPPVQPFLDDYEFHEQYD